MKGDFHVRFCERLRLECCGLLDHPNTDWFKEVLKPRSAQTSYNLTLSGGSDVMRYFISLGKQGQEGNYYRSATRYDQYNFRTNIDGRVSKNINISFDVAGREEDRRFPTRSAGDLFRMVMRGKPTQAAYWPNGAPGPDIEYGNNPAVIGTDVTGYDRQKSYVLNSNIKLVVNIPYIKGLSLTGNAAIDKGFDNRKIWQTPWYLYSWNYTSYDTINGQATPHLDRGKRGFDAPQLTQSFNDTYLSTVNGLLNYENSFGSHAIKFLAGAEAIKGNTSYFSAFRKNYISPAVDQLFAGAALDKDNSGTGSVSSRLSYFGRVNYNYSSKYLAEFVWRYDGSYIFPENKRFGFFPGVSAGWVMSEENFWKNSIRFIDNFKLRASWGKTGNDRIAEWQYLASYGSGNFLRTGGNLWAAYYPFVTNGNVENTTLYENIVPNPNVTWEIANQSDIGFNASFLNNRLTVEADYFNYKRSQVLWRENASIPQLAGYTPPFKNIGKVSNKGFEINIAYSGGSKVFNYKVAVNSSYAKNKITFWDEPAGAPEYQKSTGHPMNTGLYYIAKGIFADMAQIGKTPHISGALPGDIIFEDVNGDGDITGLDQKRIDKSDYPTYTGGLTADFQFHQFDLSLLFQGATGAVKYISLESGLIGNYLQSFADARWTPENPNSSGPRAYDRSQGPGNTYYLHKTDYVRLKNVQFGYSMPGSLNNKLGIASARVYFSGYNLLTISPDYKDFDPELGPGNGQGYPLQRVLSLGISVTF